MTNVTLSIEESVYKDVREHSEIKWSEFVQKVIKHRLAELEKLEKNPEKESILTMLASGEALK